ncbi:MAG TPA: hypothetical protein VJB14_10225, partial [Planctomycetota bacterium]|nr:hypothetical protein [Planctomycetota bacterium]
MTLLLALAWLDLSSLLRQLEDDDPAVRDAASAAIHRMGPRVIPDLERAIADASPEKKARLADLLDRFPEYAFRTLLQSAEYSPVRRLWNAVVEGAIAKRPIPRDVWEEVEARPLKFRNPGDRVRVHTDREILAELELAARIILRRQSRVVGIQGLDQGEHERGGGLEALMETRDLLPWVLQAGPDEETFEEVYGTLQLVRFKGWLPDWASWCEEDWRIAVTLLVQVRRRPDAPAMKAPATREEALALACRGPIVRGIADALGRVFANRGRGYEEALSPVEKQQGVEYREFGALREVYGVVFRLDEQIGLHFYRPALLQPAKAALPVREAPVPDRH